jgi:hypothetical protein
MWVQLELLADACYVILERGFLLYGDLFSGWSGKTRSWLFGDGLQFM